MSAAEEAIGAALGLCSACAADVCRDCFGGDCTCGDCQPDLEDDGEPQPLLERDTWHRADTP